MKEVSEIKAELRAATKIVITAHIRPDGDAIGGCLGLLRMLRNSGKAVDVVGLEPVPERYQFLIKAGECFDAGNYDFSAVDCIIILDSGAVDRSPEFVAEYCGSIRSVNIDHHISNTGFADINFVDAEASSVGEIICSIADELELSISKSAAEALWVSIVTDTGRFSYSNTSPATMAAAGRLVGTGIDLAAINHRIYNSMRLHQLKLQARAIENLLQTENGEVALTSLSRADFDELECTPVDTEDVVNIPRSLLGVGVAVFLYEFPDEPQTKISLRTAEPYDAAEFCRELGGGGHARAAGCSMDGDIDSVRDAVLQLIHNKWFKDVV